MSHYLHDVLTDDELRNLAGALAMVDDADDRLAWTRVLLVGVSAGLSPIEANRRLLDDDPCADHRRGLLGRWRR